MATASKSRSPRSDAGQATQRDFLAEVTTDAKPRPMAAIAYGPPGVGKTSFAASIPGRVFLIDDKEDGINTLKAAKLADADIPVLPPVKQWEDVLGVLRQLATAEHGYKALVIDTLGGLERLCHDFVCRNNFNGEWGEKGFAGYGRGYEVALPEWRLMLNALDDCRGRGMSIMALTHSIVKPYKNPEAEDYDRFVPDMHHKTWSLTHRWADMVLFMNYYVEVAKDGLRAKGRGGQDRVMYTEYHAAYEAKNRSGLPSEIEMGDSGKQAWGNLKAALAEARKGGE